MNPVSATAPVLDHRDPVTGYLRLPGALDAFQQLCRQTHSGQVLGLLVVSAVAESGLYRLLPEGANKLRAEVSRRLAALLRDQDRIFILGQWEWLLVLPDLVSPPALDLAMLKVHEQLNGGEVTAWPESLFRPVFACGAAQGPEDGDEPLHLLQSARIARLSAESKASGMERYGEEMEQVRADEVRLLAELRDALLSNTGLQLFLQPQCDMVSGRFFGAEALLRWRRSNGEWVPPPRIMDGIERLGMRQKFTRWLFQQAAQMQLALQEAGIQLTLSLNLSANDLLDVELPELIAQSLAIWEVDASRLLLEITETSMVEESQLVADVLQRLRAMGLRLSIDDFGTGFAGMSYLQRLPVQEVKIDQLFIRQAVESEKAREIIAAIVHLAERLGIQVIAEGVETTEMLHTISNLGCRYAQGYLYARPMSLDDLLLWWKQAEGVAAR